MANLISKTHGDVAFACYSEAAMEQPGKKLVATRCHWLSRTNAIEFGIGSRVCVAAGSSSPNSGA